MATLRVVPRPTPGERADVSPEVEVDDDLADVAAALDEWAGARAEWDLQLRQGHDFGRRNNVEAELLFASGEDASSIQFRLDQVEQVDETSSELVLRLDERDGFTTLVRLSVGGLDVELFHLV